MCVRSSCAAVPRGGRLKLPTLETLEELITKHNHTSTHTSQEFQDAVAAVLDLKHRRVWKAVASSFSRYCELAGRYGKRYYNRLAKCDEVLSVRQTALFFSFFFSETNLFCCRRCVKLSSSSSLTALQSARNLLSARWAWSTAGRRCLLPPLRHWAPRSSSTSFRALHGPVPHLSSSVLSIPTCPFARSSLSPKRQRVSALLSSTTQEWFTPKDVVEVVVAALGGSIELDVASCAAANEVIKAARYYTKDDNALTQAWRATTVFGNFPGGLDEDGNSIQGKLTGFVLLFSTTADCCARRRLCEKSDRRVQNGQLQPRRLPHQVGVDGFVV
jgi:hypothetical protein